MASSTDYAVGAAALAAVESAIRRVGQEVLVAQAGIAEVRGQQAKFDTDLADLTQKFLDYVAKDIQEKNLQLAETRVGNLQQELDIKYGYYAEIRRMATGILQAVDTGIIDNSTLKFTTEEVMIKAPGYWLAPALVTVASWIRDDKSTSDKALGEVLKRDDYKATLFFMLLMRRLHRYEASLQWLERYFQHQDPQNLDREFIIVLEAVTAGIFHPAARSLLMGHVEAWIAQLTEGDEFIDRQKKQWQKYFYNAIPSGEANEYSYLRKHSPTWPVLDEVLGSAKTHQIFHNHFEKIFEAGGISTEPLVRSLDKVLNALVTNFDDEELPLRRKVRLNELIVEKEGDKDAATAMMDVEENIFKEKVDFLQMLGNAAFNPEAAGISRQTQALAVSLSQPWILEAHKTFTAEYRNKFPHHVDIAIQFPKGIFKTATKYGKDEKEQIVKLHEDFAQALETELKEIPQPIGSYIGAAIIAVAGLFFFTSVVVVGILLLLVSGFIAWNGYSNYEKNYAQMKTNFATWQAQTQEVLRGSLADVVDYHQKLREEDQKAMALHQLLMTYSPQNYMGKSKETARNII